MKKRFLLLLSMLICVFSLTACGKTKEKYSLSDENKEMVTNTVKTYITEVSKKQKTECEDALKGINPKMFTYKLINAWKSNMDDLGALKSIDSVNYEFEANGFIVRVDTTYEKHTATYIFFYKNKYDDFEGAMNTRLDDVNLVVNLSLGEKLSKAGLNTLMGMGSVFIVLIIIIFFISMFKYVNKFEAYITESKKKKELEKQAVNNVVEQIAKKEDTSVDEDLSDDLELVAVITAAITAYESENGNEVPGFRVHSIRRVAKRNW